MLDLGPYILGVYTLGVYTLVVYTLGVYTLGVYSLGPRILDLDMRTLAGYLKSEPALNRPFFLVNRPLFLNRPLAKPALCLKPGILG